MEFYPADIEMFVSEWNTLYNYISKIHDHSFTYIVIVHGIANMNQHKKRRLEK
jgi:hypothetical protein